MKAFTDIEQSKKLKELGLDVNTADMSYVYDRHLDKLYGDTPYVIDYKVLNENVDIPCWSLAALLDVIKQVREIKHQRVTILVDRFAGNHWYVELLRVQDERNLKGIIDEIEANKNQAPDYDLATYDRFLSWLKSLKERYTWK